MSVQGPFLGSEFVVAVRAPSRASPAPTFDLSCQEECIPLWEPGLPAIAISQAMETLQTNSKLSASRFAGKRVRYAANSDASRHTWNTPSASPALSRLSPWKSKTWLSPV